ncbi:hypothetical protein PCANC_24044 [Puccinia coronata f. sp. avenae]|uniref:CST complex subunit Stn1 N-terminal domain-containing protein n=1 Tax=Puccinia coronata f. sp. avenae TaxID=200324 RepID=A0A2N5S3Z5_9BASI|nr:hypothetical protein PCANC_24044 [Puccinia coronata f. sp. avenae]PLW23289.1 hypothetical protein PCASD_10948 [Puccinia coronata f. sp. avenae]
MLTTNYFDLTRSPSPPLQPQPLPQTARRSSSPCTLEVPTVYSRRRPKQEPAYLVISDEDDDKHHHHHPSPATRLSPRSPASTCSSSADDAAEVERSLLLHSHPQQSPPRTPPPRFLPSDIKLLNVYLCKPIATVMATCSSLILPPAHIPGLPLDRLETLYAQDPWRIKSESISAPGVAQKISCWIYGKGWPAKTFVISGWLVGIDRREKFITYHVDDGTAVLECQVHTAQLNQVFDTSSQHDLPHEKKTRPTTRPPPICDPPDLDTRSTEPTPPRKKVKTDPRLDPYRRLEPSNHQTSTKPKSIPQPEHEKVAAAAGAVAAEPVTEETIAKYAGLKIGVVLRLVGKPKALFRDTKRVFDLEKAVVFKDDDHQVEEEIRFRNHLRFCRSSIYSQPFRLANVWPEGLASSDPATYHSTSLADRSTALKENQSDQKETRPLKLPSVSRLNPSQITFSRYLNYVSHYLISRYDDEATRNQQDYNYHEMKKKMDGSETILVEDFSIEDILEDAQPDDAHARLRCEMHKFTDKLVSQGSEGRDGDGGDKTVEKRATISRSVFLTEQDDSRWARKRVDTRKAMLTRAIQALVHQGTIIISPRDERRFTLPNIHSLGPKILQIIAQRQQQYPALALVDTTHIRAVLARDQLWKPVLPHAVDTVLRKLQLHQTGPHTWRIPPSTA